MDNKKGAPCKHLGILGKSGFWHGRGKSGEKIGGYIVKCWDCGKELNIAHEEWKKIPLERKPPLPKSPEPHIPDVILDQDEDYKELTTFILKEYKEHIQQCELCKRSVEKSLGLDWKAI